MAQVSAIKLVTFDALHTLVTPRKPIHIQYSEVFAPFLGSLSPSAIKRSFKSSLKQIQMETPAYRGRLGAHGWWSEVIARTAIGAGADRQAVDASLDKIVTQLMDRFSSSKGYKLFDDALPVLCQLQGMNVRTALISNSDARMRHALDDLGISPYLHPLVLSEEEGIEKPNAEIFRRALKQALGDSAHFSQGVHVGDELESDFYGAKTAGMQALLIRRPGPVGDQEHKRADEELGSARVISSLHDVIDWVRSPM